MHNNFTDAHTTDVFIPDAIARQGCYIHGAPLNFPCWSLVTSNGVQLKAICNKRAKKAGYNATVSNHSLRNRAPVKK